MNIENWCHGSLLYSGSRDEKKQNTMSSEPSISWGQFQKAYIGCIAKLAEFTV